MSVAGGRVWFTSDLHIAHRLVAGHRGFWNEDSVHYETDTGVVASEEVGTAVCDPDTEEHDRWLAELWDSTVAGVDTVWVLGDIAMNSRKGLEWLAERPGRKHLIAGNHDTIHPMHSRAYREHRRYAEVFESVAVAGRLKFDGHDVLLSHMPYLEHEDGAGRRDGSYPQWRLPDLGLPLIHGHTHEATQRVHGLDSRQLHVGIDAWRALVSVEIVLDWLSTFSSHPEEP